MTGTALSSLQVNDALPAALPVPLFAAPGMTMADPVRLPEIESPAEQPARGGSRPVAAPIWRSVVVHGLLISVIWGLSAHPGTVLHHASSSDVAAGSLIRASLISVLPGATSPSRAGTAASATAASAPRADAVPAASSEPFPPIKTSVIKAPATKVPAFKAAEPVTPSRPTIKTTPAPKTASVAQHIAAHHKPSVRTARQVAAAAVSSAQSLPSAPSASPLPQLVGSTTTPAPLGEQASAALAMRQPSRPASAATSASTSTSTSAEPAGGPVITQARYIGPPPQLEYPAMARRLGQQGRVVVEVWLDAAGEVLKSQILDSPGIPALEGAALRYVAASHFAPYTRDGQSHAARLHLTVDFRLH